MAIDTSTLEYWCDGDVSNVGASASSADVQGLNYWDDGDVFNQTAGVQFTQALSWGCEIQIAEQKQYSFANEIQVMEYTPPAVADDTNPLNDFAPSIYIDGATITSNSATAKTPSPLGVDIALDWGSGINSCDLYGAQMNLFIGGGSFSILSQDHIADIGTVLTLFGLQALVTYEACVSGNAAKGYKTEGIFGDARNLNKQILLEAQSPALANYRAPMHQAYLAQPASILWQTVSDCARAVANAAGIGLNWMAPDAPMVDAFLETGLTIGDALRSLASRVGAWLLWDGGHNWVVTTPDMGYGGWTGPRCELIRPGGIEVGTLLDQRGSILYFPVPLASQGNAIFLPKDPVLYPPAVPVIPIGSFRTTIPGGGTLPIALPADCKITNDITSSISSTNGLVYQIIVDSGASPIGDAGVCPTITNPVDGSPVPDTSHWAPLAATIAQASDGTYRVMMTSSQFPSGLSDNQFTLNVGYTRDTSVVNQQNQQAFQDALARQRLAIQAQMERLRYFETQEAKLDFAFTGSIALPGNRTSLSYDGCALSDCVVKTFSLTYPGSAQVTAGKYVKLIQDSARSLLDNFLATGVTH